MYHAHIERLNHFVAAPELGAEVVAAKSHYFKRTGEVFEDDEAFEQRMALFFEWFLFDRQLGSQSGTEVAGMTPVQLFIEKYDAELTAEERVAFRNLAYSEHSLFQVMAMKPETIVVRHLFNERSLNVFERRKPVGMETGDIIEARLIMSPDDRLMFSPAFCFHPREVRAQILKMVRQHQRSGDDHESFIFKLSYLRLKLDRYKHVRAHDLYAQAMLDKGPRPTASASIDSRPRG